LSAVRSATCAFLGERELITNSRDDKKKVEGKPLNGRERGMARPRLTDRQRRKKKIRRGKRKRESMEDSIPNLLGLHETERPLSVCETASLENIIII